MRPAAAAAAAAADPAALTSILSAVALEAAAAAKLLQPAPFPTKMIYPRMTIPPQLESLLIWFKRDG